MREKIDRYEIRKEIGRGGMATVYTGYDTRMKREVAIKVLLRELLTAPNLRERFSREAEVIAGLDHPSIVPVYDFGEDDGDPFLVMRFMSGGSLADKLKAGKMSLGDSAIVVHRVATALDRAHQMGIVHRDLKPGNVLFDQYGNAFLSDFGIVKVLQEASSMTGTGTLFGTPHYMSPEQVVGEVALDGRSDIYALGIMLYEMLSGETPYDAATPLAVAFKHVYDDIPHILDAVKSLPPAVETLVNKALAKDRDERYQTAGELDSELLKIASVEMDVEDLIKTTGTLNRSEVMAQQEETTVESTSIEVPVSAEAIVSDVPPVEVKPPAQAAPPPQDSTGAGVGAAVPPGGPPPSVPRPATGAGGPPKEKERTGLPGWVWILGGVILLALIVGAVALFGQGGGIGAVAEATSTPTEEPATNTPSPTDTPAPSLTATDVPPTPTETPPPGGQWIALVSGPGISANLWLMPVDGRPDGSDRTMLTESGFNNHGPRWSPDGKQIVFRGDAPGAKAAIFLANADGSGEVQMLTDGTSNDTEPAWSPDGSQIVFASDREGTYDIYIMNADGSDVHRITFGGSAERSPNWSPDGNSIVYVSNEKGGNDIYVILVDGREQTRLTENVVTDYNPIWSPDGSKIVYISEARGNPDIWIMNADGSDVTQLTTDLAADLVPGWSPDGDKILFISKRQGNGDLWVMNVDGSNQEALTFTEDDESEAVWQP
jgi:serine/threonine-protein kinase